LTEMSIQLTIRKIQTYGSSRLRLRPLQPFVGLDATSATSMATTAKQTALQEWSRNQHFTVVQLNRESNSYI
jgi:hypothetical protein